MSLFVCQGSMQQPHITSSTNVYFTAFCQTMGNVPSQENPNVTQRYVCWQSGFCYRWWNRAWSRHGRHVGWVGSSCDNCQQVMMWCNASLWHFAPDQCITYHRSVETVPLWYQNEFQSQALTWPEPHHVRVRNDSLCGGIRM